MRLILNILAFAVMIVMNTLAVTLPLNDQSTSEISDRLDIMITPAGYVFFHLEPDLSASRPLDNPAVSERPAGVTAVPGYEWTFRLEQYIERFMDPCMALSLFLISVFVMLGLLGTLIALYKRLLSIGPSLLDRAPFSIYLGWISVATIVNITYYLTDIGWDGFGVSALVWAYLGLIAASILAFSFRIAFHDFLYPLVIVWAFIGIGIKTWGSINLCLYRLRPRFDHRRLRPCVQADPPFGDLKMTRSVPPCLGTDLRA